jgi:hypothetical protein
MGLLELCPYHMLLPAPYSEKENTTFLSMINEEITATLLYTCFYEKRHESCEKRKILSWAAALVWQEHLCASTSQPQPQLLAGSPLLIRSKGRGQPKGSTGLSGGRKPVFFLFGL